MADERAPRKANEILTATVDQIILRGLSSVRVNDVANALHMSTGLIHYHFSTKGQLILAAFQYEADAQLSALRSIIDSDAPADVRLEEALVLYGPTGSAAGWRLWIDGWSEALRNDEIRAVIKNLNATWADAIAELLGQQNGGGDDDLKRARDILTWIDGASVRLLLDTADGSEASRVDESMRGFIRELIAD